MSEHPELDAVAERYARRSAGDRYSPQQPDVQHLLRERRRALLELMAAHGVTETAALDLAEVGCGSGNNLIELIDMGFSAARLQGVELLPERHALARAALPEATRLWLGDASTAPIADGSQDLVLQFTVFSSLLDDVFQERLAGAMWRWVKPGGAVLWYDFTVDNPFNRDVRGVPLARVQALFPQGRMDHRRITLAPPLARALCRVHPGLLPVFNLLPWLRTHVLAWVEKPR